MRSLIPAIILVIVIVIGGTAAASHFSIAAPKASAQEGPIPDEAIRIRIIANSDSDVDQAVKRAVRDRVSEEIVSWGKMPSTIDAARALIRSHLQDVQEAADSVLQAKGADYGAKVELAKVPFPAKTFEGYDYPAGEYEALRVTLGAGEGANWWCVLFPALCLAGAASAEEASAESSSAVKDAKDTQAAQGGQNVQGANASQGGKAGKTSGSSGDAKSAQAVKTSAKAHAGSGVASKQDAPDNGKPKTEFFLVVLIKKLFAWIASLFS